MTSQPIRQPVRILGIDPGLRRTGWGVIEIDGNRLIFIGCGSVEPPDTLPLASRLLGIHEGLAAVLGDFRPAEAAVEQTFVNKDGVATLKLGQARGVFLLRGHVVRRLPGPRTTPARRAPGAARGQFSPASKLIFSSMISRRAMSSGDSFSRDSTSGRLPRLSCFTRRETTLIRMLGSNILPSACLM